MRSKSGGSLLATQLPHTFASLICLKSWVPGLCMRWAMTRIQVCVRLEYAIEHMQMIQTVTALA